MVATRQLSRVDSDRWLYRTAGGDFGPVTTDGMLAAIEAKKVSLETKVSVLGSNRWAEASEFALFRDHFEKCKERWSREDAKRLADEIGRKMELRQRTSVGAGLIMGLGAIAGLATVGWVVWRLSLASPIGIERLPLLGLIEPLPAPPKSERVDTPLPVPAEIKVARLGEPESYDVAGVAIGGAEAGHVTKMQFDESGEVQGIPEAELDRVMNAARTGLYACARDAAVKSAGFGGTDVGFTVSPLALTRITIGSEARGNPALVACVKAALARVSVPAFGGSERRVTIPLKVAR